MNERLARAVDGWRPQPADPKFEVELGHSIRWGYDQDGIRDLYLRFVTGEDPFDSMMRRAIWRASCRAFGDGVDIAPGAMFEHPETFEIGDGVTIGANVLLRGRPFGQCRIGNHVWIGADSKFDGGHIVLEDFVGWGAGASIVAYNPHSNESEAETLLPSRSALPVRVERGADIGEGARIFAGVTIGSGAVVAAYAVVSSDIESRAVVAGAPARFMQFRADIQRTSPFPPDEFEVLFRKREDESHLR